LALAKLFYLSILSAKAGLMNAFYPSAKAGGNEDSNEYGKVESNVLFIKQNLFARARVPTSFDD